MKKLIICALALVLTAGTLTACRNPMNGETGDTSTSTVHPTTQATAAPTTKPTTKPTEAPTTRPTESTGSTDGSDSTDASKDVRHGRRAMPHF